MSGRADPKLIESQWEHFRETALAAIDPPLSTDELQLARACFYFGAMGTLGFLESVHENAGRRHMRLAMEQLNREFAEYSAAHPHLSH